MQTSCAGIALITRYEGFSARVYRCPAGYLTIGYGHLVRHAEEFSEPISEAEARQLLQADMQGVEAAIARLIHVSLRQNQFDALASFTYNLGAGRLQMSRLRQCINRGEYAEAADEFQRWVVVKGRKLPGLIARRAAEAALFRLE